MRVSGMLVTALQLAQRIDLAPGGSGSGLRQTEQSTSRRVGGGYIELREKNKARMIKEEDKTRLKSQER